MRVQFVIWCGVIELAKKFTRQGFEFEQVERCGDVAIYRKRRRHWGAGSEGYEVIVVKRHKAWVAHGKEFPASEGFPASEEWGRLGYTYCDLAGARKRFDTLIGVKSKKGGTYSKTREAGVS